MPRFSDKSKDRKIRIQYRRKGEEVQAEGVVNPLGIVFKDHIIYLACTYWEYKDVRHLVMHRIHEVEVLEEPMEKLEGFNLAEHIKSGAFQILEGAEKIKLKVIFYGGVEAKDHPATHLRETPLSPDQRVTNLVQEIMPERTFDDLILPKEVMEISREVVQEHHRVDLLRSYNLEPRNRLLLIGPPGNTLFSTAGHGAFRGLVASDGQQDR